MTRQRERAGQREAYLLLRSPFVEALAVDPLGGARAEAGRDERRRILLGEADSAHRHEGLQVPLAARGGQSAHFVLRAESRPREPTRVRPRALVAVVSFMIQSGFNSILPHTHRPGHETTRRATSPGATGLLCTDARVRGPCDCVPHPPGLSPLCTDARIANQPKCIPPPLGVGPSSFFISASSHRNLRLAWRRLYAARPSPQPQRRSLRSRRAT